jgi:hypothetical protein
MAEITVNARLAVTALRRIARCRASTSLSVALLPPQAYRRIALYQWDGAPVAAPSAAVVDRPEIEAGQPLSAPAVPVAEVRAYTNATKRIELSELVAGCGYSQVTLA